MTLGDLLNTAKHYWKLIVIVVAVCTLAGLGYGMLQRGTYKATATVASSVDVAALKGQAETVAAQQPDAKISVTVDTTSKTVKISAESASARAAVVGVNEVAKDTEAASRKISSSAAVSTARARQASYSRRNPLLFAAVGFAGGLFLSLCALVLAADRKAPVHSARELEELTQIPVLATMPAKDQGALLAANVTFSAGEKMDSVCLLPVATADTESVAKLLKGSFAQKGVDPQPQIVACKSVSESVDAAYEANRASATVLVVAEWNDSLRDVERTLHELKIAKANVVGMVFEEA